MRLRIGVVAAAAAALIVAGCGGSAGGNKTASGGASIAPGNAAAYISVDSNLDSAAWTKAKALLDRFPGKDKILASLRSSLQQQGLDWETDVKPALGSEIDLVWLDFQNRGRDLVGLTKPNDAAKFDALLAKSSNPPAHEVIDGWTVFAQSQSLLDQFGKARNDHGSLSDDSTFSDHFGALPSDSIAKAWVRGGPLQTAFDQRLQAAGVPASIKSQLGSLDAVTAAVTPGSDGIKIASTLSGNLDTGSSYHADLPNTLPAGALFYLSFNGVGDRLNKLLDALPNFDQTRAQLELVLGYPLKDVFDLLSGEGAIAVYSGSAGTPAVLLVAKVSDEAKAQSILNRLVTLAAASGSLQVQSVQIGSVNAKEIKLANGTSAYAAVFDGKLVTTNSRALFEQIQGSGPKLADDSAYKDAVAAAGVPDQTNGFMYADVSGARTFLFGYAASHGSTIPQVVKDNTAPLQGLVVYGTKSGSDLKLTGFLGIK